MATHLTLLGVETRPAETGSTTGSTTGSGPAESTGAHPVTPAMSRGAVPPELLAAPTLNGLLKMAALDWLGIAACIVGMHISTYAGAPWLYPVWVLVMAGRMHSLGVLLHDATHMPFGGLHRGNGAKPWRLRLLEVLAGYPIATTWNAMRYHHIRHHRDSGMATDPYGKPSLNPHRFSARRRAAMLTLIWLRHLLLVPVWTLRGPYGLLASWVPAMRPSYARVFLQDRAHKAASSLDPSQPLSSVERAALDQALARDPEVATAAREELGQVLFHLALFSATAVWPLAMAVLYFIPATVTGLLAGHRVLVEHDYAPTTDRKMTTIMATTHDHHLSAAGQLFFAPRNIGYHVVHHLHPQVSLKALPALRRWYQQAHPQHYPVRYPHAGQPVQSTPVASPAHGTRTLAPVRATRRVAPAHTSPHTPEVAA